MKKDKLPYRFTCAIPCKVITEGEGITIEEEKVVDEEIRKANDFFFGDNQETN
jgi:hypothetical protein